MLKYKKYLSYILLILGISLIFMSFLSKRDIVVTSSIHIEKSNSIDYSIISTNSLPVSANESDNTNVKDESFSLYSIIGTISIPSISIEASIIEGSDETALELGVGHIVGSGYARDNMVLAAHRATYFKKLNDLVIGDTILITDKDKNVHEYEVYDKFAVYPQDIWVLENTGEDILTLITCTDFNTKRLIIRAK